MNFDKLPDQNSASLFVMEFYNATHNLLQNRVSCYFNN